MVPKILQALDAIRAHASSRNRRMFDALMLEMEGLVLVLDRWPADLFERIEAMLNDQEFLNMRQSWKLLRFVDTNWDQLTGDQRERARNLAVRSFDRFRDSTGAMVASEILGEKLCDSRSLEALRQLGRTARLPARALAPHGLEMLALNSSDATLRAAARQELEVLSRSADDETRREAELSIARVRQG
jgi:hypothetical protein